MALWKKRTGIAFGVCRTLLIAAMAAYPVMSRATVAEGEVEFVESIIAVSTFSFLGAFLIYHRPDHRIGRLILAVGLPQQKRLLNKIVKIALVGGAGERRSSPWA